MGERRMDREEALTRRDHYRCKRCGQLSPIEATSCTRPTCQAQLGIYGEIILAEGRVVSEAPTQKEKKVKEPRVRKERQPREKKEKRPLREKKPRQTSSAPAMPTGGNWIIMAVSLLLSAAMILLLLRARANLLVLATFNDSWRAKYWRYDAQYCMYPVIPILVSMLMVLYFGIKKNERPVVNVSLALFQAILVGWFMYLWEEARCDSLSLEYCSMCVLAALNCALWLNTIPTKWPVLYLVAGSLLEAWGVFEMVIGESVYFDNRFTLLLLEAGILLILTGVRKLRVQKRLTEGSL